MKKARFDFSEVALAQVETVYETIKKFVSNKNYESLAYFLNTTTLSAKQYYHLLDELIDTYKLFGDIKFAKILFSSELQANNDEYTDLFGEPLTHTLLYEVYKLSNDIVYELLMDKQSKINFNAENINRDNVLQALVDNSKYFTDKQFVELTKLFIYDKKVDIYNVNDFGKTPLDLFLYRKKINKDVFELLIEKFYLDKKEQFESDVITKIKDYLSYSDKNYSSLNSKDRLRLSFEEFDRLFN